MNLHFLYIEQCSMYKKERFNELKKKIRFLFLRTGFSFSGEIVKAP